MNGRRNASLIFATIAVMMMFVAVGCKKPAPKVQAPPPPPPSPTANITATPTTIEKGGTVQLQWRTDNATDVSIDGLGKVDPVGTREVTPTESTSYRLVAKGPGGTQDATARVTVTTPAPPVKEEAPSLTDQQWFEQNVKDIFFDYDSHDLRPDAQQTAAADAKALAQKPNWKITIQGHADERGSTEYNLTLGDVRATAVKNALIAAGVAANRIDTRSFGKEQPFCTESNEACWQQNRRGHFVLAGH